MLYQVNEGTSCDSRTSTLLVEIPSILNIETISKISAILELNDENVRAKKQSNSNKP